MSKVIRPENIQVRIRKNQSRASAVGITYWMASIVLFVLSIFPYVGNFTGYGMDGHLWVISFLEPLLALFSAKAMTGELILYGVASILYICLLVFTLINFIISTTRLFRITKKNPTNKLGYNRAAKGTKTMGKAFARMFFWMLTVTVSVLLLGDGSFTLFFYIAFAVALLFHFICNFSACKISYFQTTEDRFKPIERVRTEGRAICVLRNAWQFVSIILIVVFMDKFGLMLGSVFNLADATASATIMQNNLLDGVVIPVILLVILLCLVVCIRHATGTTEYHEYGLKARGMKTCRIFATIIAVFALVGAVVVLLVPEGTVVPKWAFLAIFAVAAQWVGAENMFAELSKKTEEEVVESEEEKEPETKAEKKARKKLEKIEKAKRKLAEKEKLARLLNDEDGAELPVYDESAEVTPVKETEETLLPETMESVQEAVVSETVEDVAPETVAERAETEIEPTSQETPSFRTIVVDAPTYKETIAPTPEYNPVVIEAPIPVKSEEETVEELKSVVDETVEETTTESETIEETVETEEMNEPVEELSPEEIKARRLLKNKWINMGLAKESECDAPATGAEPQLVYCPTCNKKLSVKFGTDVAKCPACKSMFVLKKAEGEVMDTPATGTPSIEQMSQFAAMMPPEPSSNAYEPFGSSSPTDSSEEDPYDSVAAFVPTFPIYSEEESKPKAPFEGRQKSALDLADEYLAEAEAELKRLLYMEETPEPKKEDLVDDDGYPKLKFGE